MRALLLTLTCTLLAGCGKPSIEDRPIRPSEVLDFDSLYASRCAGCHGNDGVGSGSIALHDPVLLNILNSFDVSRPIRSQIQKIPRSI